VGREDEKIREDGDDRQQDVTNLRQWATPRQRDEKNDCSYS
jgi:hypothetical protein